MSEPVKYRQFEVGNTVRLNSGGPLMTVTKVASYGDVDVAWTDSVGAPHVMNNLPPSTLTRVIGERV